MSRGKLGSFQVATGAKCSLLCFFLTLYVEPQTQGALQDYGGYAKQELPLNRVPRKNFY